MYKGADLIHFHFRVSGLSPFLGKNDNETISNVLRCNYDFDAEQFAPITAGCKDFIKKLLVKNPR